jgi:hypothetical protein
MHHLDEFTSAIVIGSLSRHSPVTDKIGRQKHRAGAQLLSANGRHGRTHAKLPPFIRSGAHDGAKAIANHAIEQVIQSAAALLADGLQSRNTVWNSRKEFT